MLERVSACLDPGVQHLFRRLEAPARSRRVLGQAFWRNRGDDIDAAAWWPLYLSKVRESSRARDRSLHHHVASDRVLPSVSTRSDLFTDIASNCPPPHIFSNSRFFTRSSILAQQIPSEAHYDTNAKAAGNLDIIREDWLDLDLNARNLEEERRFESEDPFNSPDVASPAGESNKDDDKELQASKLTAAERLQQILDSHDGDRRGEAWTLFISARTLPSVGRQVVRYMSLSASRIDLGRALTAYDSLSRLERSSSTYYAAVQAAVKLRNYTKAKLINREAVKRHLGNGSSTFLVSHFVKSALWRSAADTLSVLEDVEKNRAAVPSDVRSTGAQGRRKYRSHWSEVDEMVSLPTKLLSLVRRLSRRDPVLVSNENQLRKLADRLLDRVVFSPKIMSVITAKGFLTLFSVFKDTGLAVDKHYFTALHTLHKSRGLRNRVQLAVLIYRNLRFVSPDAQVPKWVLGAMISMCCDAGYPSETYDILLKEFTKIYEKPDAIAYQRSMTACARQGDVRAVEDLFARFCQDHGMPSHLAFFTPLLYAHASIGNAERTQHHFNRLYSQYGVSPDLYCWNILLHAHARAQDGPSAFRAFESMTKQGIKPNAHTFGTLMGVFGNTGDTQAVHYFVDLARKHSVPGTSAMIDALVHSYCLNDELEDAENLAEAATDMDLEGSTTRMWNTILRHYAFQQDSVSVLRIQHKMRELAVKPDSMTYAALMSALVILGRTTDALKILRSLHFSQKLTADLFHYSIILQGFAQENNRDMAAVIYHEILERFPRPSASSRLAMLKVQNKRDQTIRQQQDIENESRKLDRTQTLDNNPQLHAVEFLSDILSKLSSADLASKLPQPGFQRRPARAALPSIYVEFVTASLLAASDNQHAFHTADMLIQRYTSMIQASYLDKDDRTDLSVQLLTAYIVVCSRKQQWKNVTETWNKILSLTLARGRRFSAEDLWKETTSVEAPPLSQKSRISPYEAYTTTVVNEPLQPRMSPKNENLNSLNEQQPLIVHAQRFVLSVPLTRYMQALDTQKRQDDIINVVRQLEDIGFVLTSKNWNTFIQCMAKSSNPSHQLLAFTTFEKKLLPNTPPWKILRRGKWFPPSDVASLAEGTAPSDQEGSSEAERESGSVEQGFSNEMGSSEAVEGAESENQLGDAPMPLLVRRTQTERTSPGVLVPTYLTTVYLGNAMIKFQKREVHGEKVNLRDLRREAPRTLELVSKTPYIRDRAQGVLLRGRRVKGDPVKRPRVPKEPDRAGLQGSKSPLDHIPSEHLHEIETSFELTDKASPPIEAAAAKLKKGERYTGQVLRSSTIMEKTGNYENGDMKEKRIEKEVSQKIAIVDKIRKDAKTEQIVIDAEKGEPHIDPLDILPSRNLRTFLRRKAVPIPKRALLDPHQSQFEQMASQKNQDVAEALDMAASFISANGRNIDKLTIASETAAADAAVKALRPPDKVNSHEKLSIPLLKFSKTENWSARALGALAIQRLPQQAWTMTERQKKSFWQSKEIRMRRMLRSDEQRIKRDADNRRVLETEARIKANMKEQEELWQPNRKEKERSGLDDSERKPSIRTQKREEARTRRS